MKATIEFSLPEDREEHQLALDGWKWRGALAEFDEEMRHLMKYEDAEDTTTITVQKVREKLHLIVSERHLTLD